MKTLSFIIPSYNSSQFLDKGIGSFLDPNIIDRLDIIIVNDGSTDDTPIVAQKFCDRYPDSIRLINQVNKGHGGALNTGCAAAQGKYLKVIDADDWVITENLPEFIRKLETCTSDVVLTQYHTIDISNGEVKEWKCFSPEFGRNFTFDEIMAQWRSFKWGFTLHGMTYRRDFYQKAAYLLPEHVFYEDYDFVTFPGCQAATIMPLDLFIYEYRIGDVNQSVSAANQLKRIGHTETVLQDMLEKYSRLPEGPGKNYAAVKIEELFLSYLTTVLLVNPQKSEGRKQALQQKDSLCAAAPEIFAAAKRKYQVFSLMNRLHISKKTWDSLMNSGIYKMIRK